ncbi:MAG: DUF4381 domain-containing protein [Dokdonella sp.]|uniref:DUF4381 domain-containing protein n=1 Tax=Dokdonella sp. TaxID=2291710 RepID=UPI00326742D8
MSAAAATSTPIPGPELRDIHLPPAPSWWPPAPGWWILAALVLVALFFATRWLVRRKRERAWRRRVHAELERIATSHAAQPDPARVAIEVSQLLRRVSMMIEPEAAALRDDAWLAFLDAQWPKKRADDAPFRGEVGRTLLDAPYRRTGDASGKPVDARALLDLARSWLRAVLPGRRARV